MKEMNIISLKEQIIGVWSLVSYRSIDVKGNLVYPLGEDATGFLMFHPEGYMSAQLMRQNRPIYSSKDLHDGSIEEMAEAASGFLAYAGKYEVNEENDTLLHYVEVSMNPIWLGQEQPRVAKIEGNKLSIYNGLNPDQKLVWKRIK